MVRLLLMVLVIAVLLPAITVQSSQGETGKGKDIFRVILTIFGVDKSKGDVIAIVTANQMAKVKLFSAQASNVIPVNSSVGPAAGGLIEYVATFPNVTVNSGDPYKACAILVNNLSPNGMICASGNNSPASRPEFVDLSLNATGIKTREEAASTTEEDDTPDEG